MKAPVDYLFVDYTFKLQALCCGVVQLKTKTEKKN